MGAALQEVELTKVADDPNVHFGDVIQVCVCVRVCSRAWRGGGEVLQDNQDGQAKQQQ